MLATRFPRRAPTHLACHVKLVLAKEVHNGDDRDGSQNKTQEVSFGWLMVEPEIHFIADHPDMP